MRQGPPDVRVVALYALARDIWGATDVSAVAVRTAAVRVVEQQLDDDDADVRTAAFLVFCATRPRLIAYLLQVNPRLRRQLETAEAEGRFVALRAEQAARLFGSRSEPRA